MFRNFGYKLRVESSLHSKGHDNPHHKNWKRKIENTDIKLALMVFDKEIGTASKKKHAKANFVMYFWNHKKMGNNHYMELARKMQRLLCSKELVTCC